MPIQSLLFCEFNLTLTALFENKGIVELIANILLVVGIFLIWSFEN